MTRTDISPTDGLNIQIGLLLSLLEDATQEWRGELGDVTDEAILWQPFPGSHSIGALILHMADVEAYWLHEIGAGQERSQEELSLLLSEETQQYQMSWPTPPAQPLAWYCAQQDEIRTRTRQIVRTWSDPEKVGVRQDGEFTMRWLLGHVISHESYHGGQAVLLKLLHEQRKS